jgi:hypothetical protein
MSENPYNFLLIKKIVHQSGAEISSERKGGPHILTRSAAML